MACASNYPTCVLYDQVVKEITDGGADYCFECIGLASLMKDAFSCSREVISLSIFKKIPIFFATRKNKRHATNKIIISKTNYRLALRFTWFLMTISLMLF